MRERWIVGFFDQLIDPYLTVWHRCASLTKTFLLGGVAGKGVVSVFVVTILSGGSDVNIENWHYHVPNILDLFAALGVGEVAATFMVNTPLMLRMV